MGLFGKMRDVFGANRQDETRNGGSVGAVRHVNSSRPPAAPQQHASSSLPWNIYEYLLVKTSTVLIAEFAATKYYKEWLLPSWDMTWQLQYVVDSLQIVRPYFGPGSA
jgi:hypothetical protein